MSDYVHAYSKINPQLWGDFQKAEQEHFIAAFPAAHPVSFYAGTYDPQDFYRAVCGLENEPEGGQRCKKCFRLRLTEAAREAAALGADYFATTLTISPMKNAEVLNTIGAEVGSRITAAAFFL